LGDVIFVSFDLLMPTEKVALKKLVVISSIKMTEISAYSFTLEPEQKHVFVTQIREEEEDDERPPSDTKRIPVVAEERGTLLETGKNTLQKTLLLRREAEVDKIQYELEKKKIDFDKRMEECRLKKEDLKLKQKVIQERISKFDKFVKENEAKRKRAIVKYQQEKKLKEIKGRELEKYYSELSLLLLRQQKMKEKLIAYQKFENYLTHVLDRMPEGYLESTDNMLTALMMRFRTLSSTNSTLAERLSKSSDEVENGQKAIQDLTEGHMKELLICNSELASSQKNMEDVRERNLKLEQIYNTKRLSFRQQTETLGQIEIAIDNIAERCTSRSKSLNNLTYSQKLELIQGYLQEREDVLAYVKSISGDALVGNKDKTKGSAKKDVRLTSIRKA